MSLSTEESREERVLPNAQEWEALAEYERVEAAFELLKRISGTCLRHGHLRVMEREEFMCYGAHADSVSSTRRLLLYGRVRYCHREALLALVRQVRLHSVRDLDTVVTAGLQAGDLVPHLLLEPLTPSLHTNAYLRWYRVYCAMRCGIFRCLRVQQQKMRHRLRQLMHESVATPLTNKTGKDEGGSAAENLVATSSGNLNSSGHASTLRFYTQELGDLFEKEAGALNDFMAATKETRVSLACIAATVPSVFVAWSCHYPDCMDWLQRHLFSDSHLQETLATTGLSGRYAVLLDKDPWLSFAAEHGDVLPRPPEKETFRIELLQPLSKRAQIVLLNVDEDAAEARTAFEHLNRGLRGWQSPEVDLLSLWCGHQGLQSEVATLFHIETLPFIVDARPGGRRGLSKVPSRVRVHSHNSRRPVIARSSRDTTEVTKDMYGIADTPKMRRRRGEAGAPTLALSEDDNVWHNLPALERARIADRLSTHIAQRRLPLCFTAFVGREYVIRNPYTNDPCKALECIVSSCARLDGEYVTGHDLMPVATELRRMHQLDGFKFNVSIVEPSTPLVSSLDWATSQFRLQEKTHVATCSHCQVTIDVGAAAHVRCLHCPSSDRRGVLCEVCAFTALCHPPQHILLKIPPGVWAPSLPLLWGPSNVAPLAMFAERSKPNRFSFPHSIYCNRCRSMIRGIRWKCARCYQYDLCDPCARIYSERAVSTMSKPDAPAHGDTLQPAMFSSSPSPLRSTPHVTPHCGEDATHPMLFIPHTQGSNTNGFLKPACSEHLGEWLLTL
ncbi:zinc finger protein [Leishmania braziliensis]|nr:zinc finger protein [Leishmania braziliensis]